MNPIKKRSVGISLSYIYTMLNAVIGIFLSAYIIRQLGKTEYGVYQSMSSFLSYLTVLEFGTASIMTRNLSLCKKDGTDNDNIQRNVSTIWNISLILTCVIAIGVAIFYALIEHIYSGTMTIEQIKYGKLIFAFMAFRLIFSFLTQGLKGCTLAFEYYSISQIINLIYLILRSILVVLLLIQFNSALAIVLVDLAFQIAIFLYYYYFCRVKLKLNFSQKYFSNAIFKEMIPLALALFVQTIVNTANNNVDKFIISVSMNPESVSVYSVGMYIFTMFSTLMTIPITMYMPQIAKKMRDGLTGFDLTKTMVQPCRLVTLIGGAILFGFIGIGKPFIDVFYGSEYAEAWLIAVIVMVPMFINMTNGVLINVLDIMNKRHMRSLCLLLTTICNIVLTIWWIKRWGMVGAAVATCICTFIGQDILMNIYYNQSINISVMWLFNESYKGILPIYIVSGTLCYFISQGISNSKIALFLCGSLFLIISGILMLIFGFNSTEKAYIKSKLHRR